MKYRPKFVDVEAKQLTIDVPKEIWEWLGNRYLNHGESEGETVDLTFKDEDHSTIRIEVGDWITKDSDGCLLAWTDEDFKETFEAVK